MYAMSFWHIRVMLSGLSEVNPQNGWRHHVLQILLFGLNIIEKKMHQNQFKSFPANSKPDFLIFFNFIFYLCLNLFYV